MPKRPRFLRKQEESEIPMGESFVFSYLFMSIILAIYCEEIHLIKVFTNSFRAICELFLFFLDKHFLNY
jgi:hypothetical protein